MDGKRAPVAKESPQAKQEGLALEADWCMLTVLGWGTENSIGIHLE
jgi:hypothetical protein